MGGVVGTPGSAPCLWTQPSRSLGVPSLQQGSVASWAGAPISAGVCAETMGADGHWTWARAPEAPGTQLQAPQLDWQGEEEHSHGGLHPYSPLVSPAGSPSPPSCVETCASSERWSCPAHQPLGPLGCGMCSVVCLLCCPGSEGTQKGFPPCFPTPLTGLFPSTACSFQLLPPKWERTSGREDPKCRGQTSP